MILINSAKFIRAEFDLSKETFFVGSNAGGKTTSTRALHFLYNSNPQKLGIPTDKTSFKKYYYPYDDSYIIYTFETFFILTYRRGDEIHKYFSKQVYDNNRIFTNNKSLNEHDDIIKYVKESSWHHPKTIEQYTDILYGRNKKFLDFSISKIKNYETFIEILNLVFNVDKAIVDTMSIKKAIQKALKRDNEIVTLDFEKYIRKLKEFETSYYFFRTFDRQRKHIDKANSIKNELLNLEDKINVLLKMINYRKEKEQNELSKANEQIGQILIKIDKLNKKKSGRKNIEDKKIPKIQAKINDLTAQIIQIEKLKEKYSLFKFEENSKVANKHYGIKEELESKSFQLRSLNEEKISAIEAYDKQIKDFNHKIEVTIPHESEMNIRSLVNSEEISYNQDKEELESEFSLKLNDVESKITKSDSDIEILNLDFESQTDLVFPKGKKYYEPHFDSHTERNKIMTREEIQHIVKISDTKIKENRIFKFILFKAPKETRTKEVIVLFHGMNEQDWTKYLPWAKKLVELTQKSVLLFPIAFHMNRGLKVWANPRLMAEVSKERTKLFSDIKNSSFINVASSTRLHFAPARFFLSGLETYNDVVKLIYRIKENKIEQIDKDATFDFFGYSAGAFLIEILLRFQRVFVLWRCKFRRYGLKLSIYIR